MKNLFWRLKFTASVIWIFRHHRGNQPKLGWNTSGKTKYKHLNAWNAALAEQQLRSLDSVGQWLYSCLDFGGHVTLTKLKAFKAIFFVQLSVIEIFNSAI